ncbi:MAG: GGDEF domain-containing protein [Pelomonas sp.]|nr:GGDEF domain-containing protein [Roseateles sp.]
MRIDVPTLIVALMIGYSLLALQLLVVRRGLLREAGLRLWAAGCWAVFGGMLMLAGRPVLPLWMSVVFGNGLLCVGAMLFGDVLRRHVQGRGLSYWEWGAAPVVILVLVLTWSWPTSARVILVSFIGAVLLLPGMLALLGRGVKLGGALLTVVLMLGLSFAALVVRGIWAWLRPAEFNDLLSGSLGQGLTFMIVFMGLLGTGFGYVLACFERVAVRLEEMAFTDGLTGCVNRSAIDALLDHNIARASRDQTPLAFAILDLDHFKQVNDRLGHLAGDATLKAFVATVRSRLRGSDVFGRMGGDEFCLVLPRTDAQGAAALLEQVRAAVQARFAQEPGAGVTVSVGVVVLGDERLGASQVYGLADQALYAAKHQGRNRVEFAPVRAVLAPA